MSTVTPERPDVDDVAPATGPLALWRTNAGIRWATYAAAGVLLLTVGQTWGKTDTATLTNSITVASAIRWSVPIMLAGLGGLYSERAGVVNIGLEGMMVLGTWFGAWGAVIGGPWMGLLMGIIGGGLGGLVHAVATVSFGVDHIVSAVAINLVAPGLARFLSDSIFTDMAGGSISQSPRVNSVGDFDFPILAGGPGGIDLLGSISDWEIFFVSDAASMVRGLFVDISYLSVLAYSLIPFTVWLLWRTRFGLRLRWCGEDPVAAASQGVNVYLYKYAGVLISGALAGFAGSFLVTEMTNFYKEGQTQGRGFIGLATMIFGNWRPVGTALGSLLFEFPRSVRLNDPDAVHSLLLVTAIALGLLAVRNLWQRRMLSAVLTGVTAVGFTLWYTLTDTVPTQIPAVIPHVITLLVLVFFVRKLRMPAADGMIYRRGDH